MNTMILGGVTIIMPLVIIFMVFKWLFEFLTDLIQPLTNALASYIEIPEVVADLLVVALIISLCFIFGMIERTRLGAYIFNFFEKKFFSQIPGYSLIKETIKQFTDESQTPFSKVALCRIFGNETMVTAFVTEEHSDGSYTVFVPTGPNPTSGNIYHLNQKYVQVIDAAVETTMRSIIACGSGSKELLSQKK